MNILVKAMRQRKSKKILMFWLPAFVWAAVIFLFSSFPVISAAEFYWQDFVIKKTAHIIEYAVLGGLTYRALKENGINKVHAGYISVVVCFFYGLTDEFHQGFTSGRQPTLRDVIIDTIGGGLAIYSIWNLLPKAPEKLKDWAKRWQIS